MYKRVRGDAGYGRYTRPVLEGVKQSVLVVDDDPAMRLLYRVNLELDGYRVVEAGTLDAARALLESEPVAVVLLDLQIGLERGDTLLEELRSREPRLPVLVVTGSADVDSGELRIDADAVLAKPFTIDELISTVQALAARAAVSQ
jgi:two-component system OmpR family response regulator